MSDDRQLRQSVAQLTQKIRGMTDNLLTGQFPRTQDSLKDHVKYIRCRRDLVAPGEKVVACAWGRGSYEHYLVSVGQTGTIVVWDAQLGLKKKLIKERGWTMTVSVDSVVGQHAAIGTIDGKVLVFPSILSERSFQRALDTEPEQVELQFNVDCLNEVKFHAVDEEKLFTCSCDESICLLNVEKMAMERRLVGHIGDISSIDSSASAPDLLISSANDRCVKVWDLRVREAGGCVFTFKDCHQEDINQVKFFPDGNAFVSASNDKSLKLFSLKSYQDLTVYDYKEDSQHDTESPEANNEFMPTLESVCFSSSGSLLFSSFGVKLFAWQTNTNDNKRIQVGKKGESHRSRISTLNLQSKGLALMSGAWDAKIKLWV